MSDQDERRGKIASFSVDFGDVPVGQNAAEQSERQIEQQTDRPPFRIVVLSELGPQAPYAAGPTAKGLFAVTNDTLDELMAGLGLRVALDLDDPFDPEGPQASITLRPRRVKDLTPGGIAGAALELRALADAVGLLGRPSGPRPDPEELTRELARILPRPAWVQRLSSALHASQLPSATRGADRDPARKDAGPDDRIDALLAQVDLPETDQKGDSAGAGGLAAVLAAVATGGRPASGSEPHTRASQMASDALQRLCSAALAHEEVRRLAQAWASLRLLVRCAQHQAGAVVEVAAVPPDAAEQVIVQLEQSPAERLRARVSLIVVDATVSATAAALDRLERWGAAASTLSCPLLVSGDPTLLGASSMRELARSQRALSDSADPRSVALRSVSARDSARWIGIALNAPALQADWPTRETGRPPCRSDATLWGSPAMAVAAIVAQAFSRDGSPFDHLGPRAGSLSGLAVIPCGAQDPRTVAATESLPPLETQAEAARCGVMLLSGVPNRDELVLTHAPMLYRGPGAARGGNAPAEATLSDQFLVGQLLGVLQPLAEAIVPDATPAAVADVARIAVAEQFGTGLRATARVDGDRGCLVVTVQPRSIANVTLREFTIALPLPK